MCNIDLEPATIWNEARVCARKAHECIECKAPIPRGRHYVRIKSLFEGSWDTFTLHVECDALRDFVMYTVCADEGGGIELGGLREELRQHDEAGAEYDEDSAPILVEPTLVGLFDAIRDGYLAEARS